MNINRLIKDLKNGNNPEENLSVYSQLLLTSYIRLSYGDFTLSFTENYDLLAETGQESLKNALEEVRELTGMLCTGNEFPNSDSLDRLGRTRAKLVEELSDIEAYLSYFQFYEYQINRQGAKLEKRSSLPDIQSIVSTVMEYIHASDSPQGVNARIQSVLGELPVRLTTVKFFELLESGCLCYTGARNDMADSFFARMEVMASCPYLSSLNPSSSELYKLAKVFDGLEVSALTADGCAKLKESFDQAALIMAKSLGNYMDMLELVNKLYILIITIPYALHLPKECEELGAVLRAYLKAVDSGDFLDIDADILGILGKNMENKEKYLGEHMFMEDALETVYVQHKSLLDGLMLDGVYMVLRSAQRLFTASSKEDISELTPYYTVEKAEVMTRIRALEDIYRKSFKDSSQAVKRCLIARAFENMPVPFDSIDKIEAYIYQSLESCTDISEKAAVAALLEDLIHSDML